MLFAPTRTESRPMVITPARRGVKGLFQRVYLALLVLFGRKIPLMSIETSDSPRRGESVLPTEPLDLPAPTRDDE
jgi:hypothetical protein